MTQRQETAAAGRETDEEFRARLREFFADHHPGRPPRDSRDRIAWTKAWLATLFDHGYAGLSWPKEFGGMELPFARQVILK
jgi:alkylation response protein AidB-like acyl-CoA dehydrogenase